MQPTAYYDAFQNYISSLENITSEEKERLEKNVNTLFMVMVLKFLQLNIPPYLFTSFFEDLKKTYSDVSPFDTKDIRVEKFVLKYAGKISNYSERFKLFMEEQHINSLLKELKE